MASYLMVLIETALHHRLRAITASCIVCRTMPVSHAVVSESARTFDAFCKIPAISLGHLPAISS